MVKSKGNTPSGDQRHPLDGHRNQDRRHLPPLPLLPPFPFLPLLQLSFLFSPLQQGLLVLSFRQSSSVTLLQQSFFTLPPPTECFSPISSTESFCSTSMPPLLGITTGPVSIKRIIGVWRRFLLQMAHCNVASSAKTLIGGRKCAWSVALNPYLLVRIA